MSSGTANPEFTGARTMEAWAEILGEDNPRPVPVENTGGEGTADGHWRDSVFANELMTGFVDTARNPISRLTIASLQDLGYEVDFSAADAFALPEFGLEALR